eukprot:6194498-Pleurochrysis_carterae.AAC.2
MCVISRVHFSSSYTAHRPTVQTLLAATGIQAAAIRACASGPAAIVKIEDVAVGSTAQQRPDGRRWPAAPASLADKQSKSIARLTERVLATDYL